MNNSARRQRSKEPIVNVMLNGGRVTSGFRAALFASAGRAGLSVNEFVLTAAAEKLLALGSEFSGLFEPGDLNTNQHSKSGDCLRDTQNASRDELLRLTAR
ncbi:hypothetical protein [Sinorhizobium fredii]|uniref:hypothetical protein n=1 Tax=Rhizobium fredii TaxID=380 RepID=UPI0035135A49